MTTMYYSSPLYSSSFSPPLWKADDEINNCEGCRESFGVKTRRHHCRACGGIYCSKCTSSKQLLPQYGFNTPQRVCDQCDFKLGSTSNSSLSSLSNNLSMTIQPSSNVNVNNIEVCLVGCSKSGKTALVMNFMHNGHFEQDYDPTIEDSYKKQVRLQGNSYVLHIVDTSGTCVSPRRRALKSCDVVMMVFAINQRSSFETVTRLYATDIEQRNDLIGVLVGTHADLPGRQVMPEEAAGLAQIWGWEYWETSAFSGINVEEVFTSVVRAAHPEIFNIRSNNQYIMRGYLTHEPSIKFGARKRRLYCLENNVLYCYKSVRAEASRNPCKSIDLTKAKVSIYSDSPCSFTITGPFLTFVKSYTLTADTTDDTTKWITALQEAIKL